MNKHLSKMVLPVAAFVVGLGIAGSVVAVQAADNTSGTNPMQSLVTAIAQKFNLNQDDVQQVFDDNRTQMMEQMKAQHEQELADRLSQAVEDGTLTQEQADKITAKMKELEAEREANRTAMEGKTDDERRAAMEQERTELKQWMTDNDIPEQFMMFGHHGGPGFGGRGFGFEKPGTTDSSTSAN